MRDYAKLLEFEERQELELIKGHTRIELTSVKTGKKTVIEHDNTFQTNVLAKQLRSLGKYNNSPWLNDTWDAADRWIPLVGGIYLFRDAIDLTGGDVEYMPPGNKMVANGSYGKTNAGTPVELGTYNPIESASSANAKVIVFDWGTSQGNGTIASVCLTSNIGGLIGCGNPSGEFLNLDGNTLYSDSWQNAKNRDGVPYNNFAYKFTVDNTQLTLTIEKLGSAITTGSIFEKDSETTVKTYSTAVDTQNNRFRAMYMGGGKFGIFGCARSSGSGTTATNTIPNGSTYKFLIYDAVNDTVTVKTITNDSGYTLLLASGYYVFMPCATDSKVFFPVGTLGNVTNEVTGFVEFDLSTGQSLQYIAAPYDIGRDANKYWTCHCLQAGIYSYGNWIIDTVGGTCYPSNGAFSGTNHWDYDALIYCGGNPTTTGTDGAGRSMTKNPCYLATVNNLETAITKDSTQTMKVIYTLTRL